MQVFLDETPLLACRTLEMAPMALAIYTRSSKGHAGYSSSMWHMEVCVLCIPCLRRPLPQLGYSMEERTACSCHEVTQAWTVHCQCNESQWL